MKEEKTSDGKPKTLHINVSDSVKTTDHFGKKERKEDYGRLPGKEDG